MSRVCGASQNRIRTVPDYRLRSLGINNTRKVGIKHTATFVITAMNLKEVCTEVLHGCLVVVCSVGKGNDAVGQLYEKCCVWNTLIMTHYL